MLEEFKENYYNTIGAANLAKSSDIRSSSVSIYFSTSLFIFCKSTISWVEVRPCGLRPFAWWNLNKTAYGTKALAKNV